MAAAAQFLLSRHWHKTTPRAVDLGMACSTAARVIGWPRWHRETTVRTHPALAHLGVASVLGDEAPFEVAGTIVCLDVTERVDGDGLDLDAVERQFVVALDDLLADGASPSSVMLCDGVDSNGLVHAGERVLLTSLPSEPGSPVRYVDVATETDALPAFHDGVRGAACERATTPPCDGARADVAANPEAVEAEAVEAEAVEAEAVEAEAVNPEAVEAEAAATIHNQDDDAFPEWLSTPVGSPVSTTRFVVEGAVRYECVGVLPPSLLRVLAARSTPLLLHARAAATPTASVNAYLSSGRVFVEQLEVGAYAHGRYECVHRARGDAITTAARPTQSLAVRPMRSLAMQHRVRKQLYDRR